MQYVYVVYLTVFTKDGGDILIDQLKGVFSSYETAVAAIKDHTPYSVCESEPDEDMKFFSTELSNMTYVVFKRPLDSFGECEDVRDI